ncbi:hypothetical protein JHK87_052792 [Glycine soja]|nr:hypothetical protein JHK87_052792 [Glycine soja]
MKDLAIVSKGQKHKSALYESLEKVNGELMMLGFISMLLVVFQGPLSKICISQNVASMWHPCSNPKKALSKSDGKSDSDTNGGKNKLKVDKCFTTPRMTPNLGKSEHKWGLYSCFIANKYHYSHIYKQYRYVVIE